MSLLADIIDLLGNLLEYFGIPADMLVPVWDNQHCGQYRSIVRMIGSNLPFSPQARVHFQIPLQSFERHGGADFPFDRPVIPSFADVMWLTEEDGEAFTKFRNDVRPLGRRHTSQCFPPPPVRRNMERRGGQIRENVAALSKITALEDELLRLRSQIAMIVTMPTGTAPLQSAPASPGMCPPPPVLTSTPGPARRCTPPPAPPPPPPPPLPLLCPVTMETLAQGSIKQQQRRTACKAERDQKAQRAGSASDKFPSMLDVLKDLNQVTLRVVERSPGGTPVRKKSKKVVSLSDPAALIAEALKRKFAHRHKEDSFDKENRSFELSPFGSPEIPSIPCNIRHIQGRLHL